MNNSQVTVPFVNLNLCHQPIEGELAQAMQQVLQRGDFVLGQAVRDFEADFAAACGVKYGVGVGCGTDAIAIALQACGIQAGDEVILPANTFIATLMGVVKAKAVPVLVDCDPETALIDLEAANQAVTGRTRAIIPVHLYGQMVSPQQLLDFATTYNLLIVEDAAQAHLARREGYTAGSVGMAAAFSFYPSKNLGGFGDGGAIVTNDAAIAQKAKTLRNYGAPQKYLHTEVGTNSRLDSLQAAVLNTKLRHLPAWNETRNTAAKQYDTFLQPLQDFGIIPLHNQSHTGHAYHLYVIRVTPDSPCDRDTLQQTLADSGIQTGIHYPIPCHLQPAYRYLGYQEGDFPHAEMLSAQVLSLPMYPGLQKEQIQQVVRAIEAAILPKISPSHSYSQVWQTTPSTLRRS
ncbi:DegT/DnrJ/EryC1/StrS aminotransferase family protein [Geitlerinema sp. PCC 9228]|jgi:dTDP-4-amino-4,6-dideoxygalactose transaminase|uniref:DegT/DnrJ/EryC1/StrS family aminotransferase n=1 Tax=Geitlerinema sp. PCC 9228 TaxID=111611 RepID=UPI0008F99873|nr:DegT/DnrJ/EryC1/StrS aminotransferase family protein [Geitlerinema sp. PCC 9228]